MNPDFWNEKFSSTPNLYGMHPNEYFKLKIDQLEEGSLLLPGEGEGRNALYAAAQYWKVVAIDQSITAQKSALTRAKSLGISIDYHVCNVLTFIPEPHSFDVLALIYFHLPSEIIAKAYSKLAKAVKVGGKVIVEGFGKNQLEYSSGGPKNKEMLYDLNELKSLFPNFTWEEEFDGVVHLEEGTGHKGPAHVIRLFGTKIG